MNLSVPRNHDQRSVEKGIILKIFFFSFGWFIREKLLYFPEVRTTYIQGSNQMLNRSVPTQRSCSTEQREFEPCLVSNNALPGTKNLSVDCLDPLWDRKLPSAELHITKCHTFIQYSQNDMCMTIICIWSFGKRGVNLSLTVLPGPLESEVVVPARVLFISQIDLFENY